MEFWGLSPFTLWKWIGLTLSRPYLLLDSTVVASKLAPQILNWPPEFSPADFANPAIASILFPMHSLSSWGRANLELVNP